MKSDSAACNQSPKEFSEGDFAIAVFPNPLRLKGLMLGRKWRSLSGEIRFDIRPGCGFRPGYSIDVRSLLTITLGLCPDEKPPLDSGRIPG
jgi:hypothetical protein